MKNTYIRECRTIYRKPTQIFPAKHITKKKISCLNVDEMKVRLRLCLTHDVFMELLSFVGNMKKLTSNTKCQVVYD